MIVEPVAPTSRVGRIVAAVSYKPGSSIAAYVNASGDVTLDISLPVDEVTTGERSCVGRGHVLPAADLAAMSDAGLVEFIRDVVVAVEMHEVDEWLRFEGGHVRVPHPVDGAPWRGLGEGGGS